MIENIEFKKLNTTNIIKIVLSILVIFLILTFFLTKNTYAVELPEDFNIDNISNEDILDIYDKITEKYSNEEIADIIKENKAQIASETGVSEGVIDAGAEFIRNTSKEAVRDIIADDENITKIRESLKEGKSAGDAVASIVEDTTTSQKINLFVKILLANNIIRATLIIIIVLFLYCTITRCVIYKKAGKNWVAGIIPFYRQVTMYKVCGLSPFLMLLWLIPIFGWIVMFVLAIMKRILLAENFGKGGLFGIGILILPPIFYSVLAFNSNIEYEEEE